MMPMTPPATMSAVPPERAMQAPQEPDQDQMALIDKPSWEQVEALLKDNAHRNFRIGIETDSTIASSIESDMAGLKDVLTAVTQFIQGVAPAVMAGAMPIDAVKEIVMTITRRARMGMAVEDALDQMKAPTPAADPNAGKAQAAQQQMQLQAHLDQSKIQMQAQVDQQAAVQKAQLDHEVEAARQQLDQQRLAMEAQRAQQQAQLDAQVEMSAQQAQAQQIAHQNQLEAQRAQQDAHHAAVLQQMQQASDEAREQSRQQFELLKQQLINANKIEVAEVTAGANLQLSQMEAANEASENARDRKIADAAPAPAAQQPDGDT